MRLFFLLILITSQVYSQVENQKWGEAEVSYEVSQLPAKSYTFDKSSPLMFGVSSFKNLYYLFISDLDGDNCPFSPSCSSFFVEAVKTTNPIKGALMFADRFTRDLNLFKNTTQYHIHSSGKFYDPVVNYDLDFENVSLSEQK